MADDESPAPKPKPPAKAKAAASGARAAPKWETDAKDRIKAALKRFQKPLGDLVANDANESQTRFFVTDVLEHALGFDKYTEITAEYMVKGEFADYGLRIDQQLVAMLECKRATTKLTPKHLRQVESYALNEGVEWVILTNGVDWQIYHVTADRPVVVDLALQVNLLGPETVAQKADVLFHISREGFRRHTIDEVWKARAATAPKVLADALLSTPVLNALRQEVRRRTKHNCEEPELARLLRETVIRPDAVP